MKILRRYVIIKLLQVYINVRERTKPVVLFFFLLCERNEKMRVLITEEKKIKVLEIISLSYDENILGLGIAERDKDRPKISGILLEDMSGAFCYIAGVTEFDCRQKCFELCESGFADLSGFGECVVM